MLCLSRDRPSQRCRQLTTVPEGQTRDRSWRTGMAGFRDVSIRWKLLAAIAVVLVLIGGAAGWTVYQLQRQDAAYAALLHGEAEGAALAQEMRAGLLLQVQALKNTMIRGEDAPQFEKYAAEFDARAKELRA